MAYSYGQDGSTPDLTRDECNPATYTCFMTDDAHVARVLNTDLPSLDVSKWQYLSSVDAFGTATWSSTLSDRKPVILFSSNLEVARPQYDVISAPSYIKEFKSYLISGYAYTDLGQALCFMNSIKPFGPWKLIGCGLAPIGANQINLGLDYTVVSTNPPHIQVTVVTDYKAYSDAGTPYFSKWDIVLGRQPYGNGDVPAYTDTGLGRVNSGWLFTSGAEPGTFNRKGLVWAFDFMDAGGNTSGGYPFIHDVANSGAVLTGTGIVPTTTGYQGGESATGASIVSDVNTSNVNAPAAMQGNGTFTVAGIFSIAANSYGTVFWRTGDPGPGNASVALSGSRHVLTRLLNLEWGNGNTYKVQSTFAPDLGSWYYISAVVTAGTPDPATKLWVGVGGVLIDKLLGVSRASTGGSPTRTPAVTAAPFLINAASDDGHTANASYAALFIYDRALSDVENQALYQRLKTKMLERGVTVQ